MLKLQAMRLSQLFTALAIGLMVNAITVTEANAQDPKYTRMLEDMVDGKYERVLYRAINFTENDKTKKDPEPYYYMAAAYLQIYLSDDPELQESYPKALKEALKYATKFVKKDKELEYVLDQTEFFEELRVAAIAQADTEMDAEKYTRAKSIYNYLVKLDLKDPSAYMMRGFSNYQARSKRDAYLDFDIACSLVGTMTGRTKAADETGHYRDEPLTESQGNLLKTSIISAAEQLDADGERAKAVELLEYGLGLFEADRSFMVTYSSIIG